jgi:hypothetical protein
MKVPTSPGSRALFAAASAAFAMSVVAAPALAEGDTNGGRSYVQTNLVSDIPG